MSNAAQQLKRYVKRAAAQLLHATGILGLISAARSRGAITVLMYHRVLPAGADTCSTPAICVTPQTFEQQLKLLRARFNVLTLSEVGAILSGTMPLPPRACLITFDDGWRDNFSHAYPIIRAADVPVTIFVATNFIGSRTCFWQERLTRLLLEARRHRCLPTRAFDERRALEICSMDDDAARAEIVQAVRGMKKLPGAEVEALQSELERLLAERGVQSPSPGDDEFMTWDELRTLAATARVDIGSHLCSHTPMPALTEDQLRAELVESKRRITAEVGKPVEAIAYPNGDYTEAGLALARQAGYSLGFSVESGCLRPGDDPLRIRRLNIAQAGTDTDAGFLGRLAGVF